MADEKPAHLLSHVEPAHPMLVKLHDDLVSIYTNIRQGFQEAIDQAFDRTSRQIGFVVTTTMPVVLKIGAKGKLVEIAAATENLKGTLFEKELSAALNPQPLPPRAEAWKVAPGDYRVYLIWQSALNLRLRTDWIEPAHIATPIFEAASRRPLPYPQEPAHWFDVRAALSQEEAIQINAIDQVYPELHLADRISATRDRARRVGPGVMEPAHFAAGIREPAHISPGIREPAHITPGIREPAHPQLVDRSALSEKAVDILSQFAEILRRSGY